MAPTNKDDGNEERIRLTNDESKAWIDKKYSDEYSKNKMTRRFLIPYPDPVEVTGQIIELSDLEDPPEDFKIPDLTSRNPPMPCSIALLKFHFWNINPGTLLSNGDFRVKVFTKLVYNQDEQHRVNTCGELCDLTRDAGPRLLKPEILQRLNKLPISRRHPQFTNGTVWEEQRTRPSGSSLTGPGGNENDSETDGYESDSLVREEIPPHLDIVREDLERLLIQLRYKDLEVVGPEGSEKHETIQISANTSDGSRRKHLAAKKLKLIVDMNHDIAFDDEGMEYIYRECGPIAGLDDGPKTRLDCIMMVGKFLDVGLTKIDKEEFSSTVQETYSDQMFMNIVKTDWSTEHTSGKRQRYHLFFEGLAPYDFRDLLMKSTLLRQQFSHTTICALRCENGHEKLALPVKSSLLYFDNATIIKENTSVRIEDVLQHIFQQHAQAPLTGSSGSRGICDVPKCGKSYDPKAFLRSMPLRLAISMSSQVSPENHTNDNIRVKFFNRQGREEIATYRWLGGIYSDTETESDSTHYRVYWTDSIRGERKTNTISMYDPCRANGKVIEGIAPSRPQNGQVPAQWWEGKFKPVLFYERVLNPDPLDLSLAAAVLGDMNYASNNGQYILQVHEPWKRASPISGPTGGLQPGFTEDLEKSQSDNQNPYLHLAKFYRPSGSDPKVPEVQSNLSMFRIADSGGYGDLDRLDDATSNINTSVTSVMGGQDVPTHFSEDVSRYPYEMWNTSNRFDAPEIPGQLCQPNFTTHNMPPQTPTDTFLTNMNSIVPSVESTNNPIRNANSQASGSQFQAFSRNMQQTTPHIPRSLRNIIPQPTVFGNQTQNTNIQNSNIQRQPQHHGSQTSNYAGNYPHMSYPGFSTGNHPESTASASNDMYIFRGSQPDNNIYAAPEVSDYSEHHSPIVPEYEPPQDFPQNLHMSDEDFLDLPARWSSDPPRDSHMDDLNNPAPSLSGQGNYQHEADYQMSEAGQANQTTWSLQPSRKRGQGNNVNEQINKRPRTAQYRGSNPTQNPD